MRYLCTIGQVKTYAKRNQVKHSIVVKYKFIVEKTGCGIYN